MAKIVGLSGGIGSGKSTVARTLAQLGAVVIDADAIVHELQKPGSPLLAEIAEAFGPGLVDASGALDREALGATVFRDAEARARLGRILHPEVGAEVARRVAAARAEGAELIVLELPLLFEYLQGEAGSAAFIDFDATLVVTVPEEIQIERQLARESYDRGEALRRIRAQLPLEEKRKMADFVIDNSGSLEQTERRVRDVYDAIMAPRPPGSAGNP